MVPTEIDSHAVRLLLDTGVHGLTLFAARLEGRIRTLKKLGVRTDVNAGGAYTVNRIEISSIRLGGMKWGKRQATVVESSAAALRDFDGMLGPVSLGVTRIAFDLDGCIVHVEVNR